MKTKCWKHPHAKLIVICPACAAEKRKHKAGGRPAIVDEFTEQPMSRQRKYQLRKQKRAQEGEK